MYRIEQRNKFSVGETIEVMKADGEELEGTVRRRTDEKGQEREAGPHARQICYVELGAEVEEYDILRRREENLELKNT